MSGLFCSSIGRKLLMSLSGLFLVAFLLVHLSLNALLLVPDGGEFFNAGAHFMATNPIIKIIEPILGIGFLVHIVYGLILTLQNRKARGNSHYGSGNDTHSVSWSSKNMFILGLTVFAFLVLHLANFWVKMKITGDSLLEGTSIDIAGVPTHVENAYALVNATFAHLWIVVVYIIGSLGLAMHLSHGFWSAFQTIGFSNQIWRKRLSVIGSVYAWFVGIGFSLIAVCQYLFFQNC